MRFRLPFLLAYIALCSGQVLGAPLAINSSSPINRTNGTVRIRMTGENGVQYYVRSSTNLAEGSWVLATGNPFAGTGADSDIDVSLPSTNATQAFFRAESAYEQRARLYISNYERQLANGGPTTLAVNGANVQNTITIAEDRTNNQIVITGNGVPNYTPTILGFNVTDGWNTTPGGGLQTFKLS